MQNIAFGNLQKMRSQLNSPVDYRLVIGAEEVPLNELIGQSIHMIFSGNIFCNHCGRKTKKSFNQGFCFPCMRKLACCDSCIMSPEKCHYSQGTCREPEWGKTNCMIPHFVYLANSSGLKVGITRHTQVPTRWIDQGAHEAIAIAETPNRYLAGITEVALKKHIADKTNWRTMLKNEIEDKNLVEEREKLKEFIPDEAQDYYLSSSEEFRLNFPVLEYPKKLKSLNLEKNNSFKGKLKGIKGQYLIFENDVVFNVRNSEGYVVDFEVLA